MIQKSLRRFGVNKQAVTGGLLFFFIQALWGSLYPAPFNVLPRTVVQPLDFSTRLELDKRLRLDLLDKANIETIVSIEACFQ